jgi:hypothetical protein
MWRQSDVEHNYVPVINFNQCIELIQKDADLKKMNFEISTFVETKINSTDTKF